MEPTRPKCLCGQEMQFVANSRRAVVWRCSCGKLLVQAGDLQEWFEPMELARKGDHAQEGAGTARR